MRKPWVGSCFHHDLHFNEVWPLPKGFLLKKKVWLVNSTTTVPQTVLAQHQPTQHRSGSQIQLMAER
jgi:hypothetical protein